MNGGVLGAPTLTPLSVGLHAVLLHCGCLSRLGNEMHWERGQMCRLKTSSLLITCNAHVMHKIEAFRASGPCVSWQSWDWSGDRWDQMEKSQYTQHDSDTVPLVTLRHFSRKPTSSLEMRYLKVILILVQLTYNIILVSGIPCSNSTVLYIAQCSSW